MIAWDGKWYITTSVLKRMGIDLKAMEKEIANNPNALKNAAEQIDIIQRHLDAHLLIKAGRFQLFLPALDKHHGLKIVRSGQCWTESRDGKEVLSYEADDGEKSHFYQNNKTLVDDSSPFRFTKTPPSFLQQKGGQSQNDWFALPHGLTQAEFDLLLNTFFPLQDGFEEMDVAIEIDIRGRLIDEKIPVPENLDDIIESRIEPLAKQYAHQAGRILLEEIDEGHIESMINFANSTVGDSLRNTRYFNSGQLRLNGERFYLDLVDEVLSLISAEIRNPQ